METSIDSKKRKDKMAIMIRMEDSTAESFIEHLLEQISERDQNHQANDSNGSERSKGIL